MTLETLHFVTISISLFTLVLATAALMPQLKRALRLVRDAVIGASLVVGLSFAGFLIWSRVLENSENSQRQAAMEGEPEPEFEFSELFPASPSEALDPLPLPTREDELAAGRLQGANLWSNRRPE